MQLKPSIPYTVWATSEKKNGSIVKKSWTELRQNSKINNGNACLIEALIINVFDSLVYNFIYLHSWCITLSENLYEDLQYRKNLFTIFVGLVFHSV